MIRVSMVVSASRSGLSLKPGAMSFAIQGAARIPKRQTPVRTVRSVVKAALASSQASRLVRLVRYSLKTGMKAADIEPSAKSSRRSEEHTSELQSQSNLVCRLLLEKKKANRAYDAQDVPENEPKRERRESGYHPEYHG